MNSNLRLTTTADHKSNAFELNLDFYSVMNTLNYSNSEWFSTLKLRSSTSTLLDKDHNLRYKLLNSPLLCVVPVLSSVSDWESLFSGDVKKLEQSFSLAPTNISDSLRTTIGYQNKTYLRYIIDTAKNSPLAMLELGVSFEVIQILRNVKVEGKNNASRFKLPLFKWRYENLQLPTNGDDLQENDWINYLIQSTPEKLSELPAVSELGKRYHSETAYPLAEQLVKFRMRATIITTLIPNLHEAKVRDMYQRILSDSSSCGKLPDSLPWYVNTERRRTHSSFFMLLYRLAYRAGLPNIHSIIAAYSWYLTIAPSDPIPIDRLGKLAIVVQSGSGSMFVAACRSCTANYLLCNTEDKQEFGTTFHCEPCRRKKTHSLAA